MSDFDAKFSELRNDIVAQGERVADLTLRAVEAYFTLDIDAADKIEEDDKEIDRIDVEIERSSIPLLAMGETDHHRIRSVLMIVKINNELERAADCAVNVAGVVKLLQENVQEKTRAIPSTFRVMANSVIGMLRDANRAVANGDLELAQRVLGYDDAVDQFKREISLDAQRKVADGEFSANFGFRLRTVVSNLERIADHCTNICEQVIYLESGKTVRHMQSGWTEPASPDDV